MSLDRFRLRAQLGAGPDGVAYRAVALDGATEVEVVDLIAARGDSNRCSAWRLSSTIPRRFVFSNATWSTTGRTPCWNGSARRHLPNRLRPTGPRPVKKRSRSSVLWPSF
jgi:hypothetical protein